MGLEAVVSDIQEKGRKEAEAIRKETQADVDKILKEALKKVESIKLTAEEEVQTVITRMMAQEDSAANLIVKRQLLNAQKEVLNEVYRETLNEISKLPSTLHTQVLTSLLHQAAGEMKAGVVYASDRDAGVVKDLIANDRTLSGFRFGGTVDTEGGIIVENVEGTIKIDLTYRTFLNGIWETGLKDAADILFT
jgi:V/A-type H+-transporting ATPase subunit E